MEYLARPENANAVRMDLVCFFSSRLILQACLRPIAQLRQIFAGLAHLHSKSIVHGNLKPI